MNTYLHASYAANGVNVDGVPESAYRMNIPVGDLLIGAAWDLHYLYLAVNSDAPNLVLKIDSATVEEAGVQDEDSSTACTEYMIPLEYAQDLTSEHTLGVAIGEDSETVFNLVFDTNEYLAMTSAGSPYFGATSSAGKATFDSSNADDNGNYQVWSYDSTSMAADEEYPTIFEFAISDIELPNGYTFATDALENLTRLSCIGGLNFVFRDNLDNTNQSAFYASLSKDQDGTVIFTYFDNDHDGEKALVPVPLGTADEYHIRMELSYNDDNDTEGLDKGDTVSAKYFVNGVLVAEGNSVRQTGGSKSTSGINRIQIAVRQKNDDNPVKATVSNIYYLQERPSIEVAKLITAIADFTPANAEAVKTAETAYNALGVADQNLVPNKDVLLGALQAEQMTNYIHAAYADMDGNGETDANAFRLNVPLSTNVRVGAAWDWENLYLHFSTGSGVTDVKVGGYETGVTGDAVTIPWHSIMKHCLTANEISTEFALTITVADAVLEGTLLLDTNNYKVIKNTFTVDRINTTAAEAHHLNSNSALWTAESVPTIFEVDVDIAHLAEGEIKEGTYGTSKRVACTGLNFILMDQLANTQKNGSLNKDGVKYIDTFFKFGLFRQGDVVYLAYCNDTNYEACAAIIAEARANETEEGKIREGADIISVVPVGTVSSGTYHIRVEYTYHDDDGDGYELSDDVSAVYYVNGKKVAEAESVRSIASSSATGTTGSAVMLRVNNTSNVTVSNYSLSHAQSIDETNAGCNWQAATCTDPKTCKDCGATEGEKLPHNYSTESGKCTNGCGKYACENGEADHGDSDGDHNHACDACGKENITDHVTVNEENKANCQTAATCDECGQKYGDVNSDNHVGGRTEWVSDADYHWHVCTGCNVTFDKAQHSYDDAEDMICNDCNYDRTEHTCAGELVEGQEATCTAPGWKDYYKCSGCGKFYEDADCTVLISDINEWKNGDGKILAKDHSWTVEYTWSEDGKSCTATHVCANDAKHNETVAAEISTEETNAPTCTEMGQTTYTATFEAAWAATQTKTLTDIPAKDHSWTVEYTWSEDGKSCTATHVCANDAKHNETVAAEISTEETKAPTCTEMGQTTYTANFSNVEWAVNQIMTLTNIPKLDHSYENGSCTVCGAVEPVEETYAAMVNGVKYETLQAAIDAAKDGDIIVLLKDLNLSADDAVTFGPEEVNDFKVMFTVTEKNITIDLNGKTISVDATAGFGSGVITAFPDSKEGMIDWTANDLKGMLMGVFATYKNGHLTLTGNGKVVTDAYDEARRGEYTNDELIALKTENPERYQEITSCGIVYAVLVNYDPDCSMTIEGGHYEADITRDSLVYTHASANEEAAEDTVKIGVFVEGGTFILGNAGEGRNGSTWIFNAKGRNEGHVWITGGTFNTDIRHQYWRFESQVSGDCALEYNAETGMYTIVAANYSVNDQHKSGKWYTYEMGYVTLKDAEDALLADAEDAKKAGVDGKITDLTGGEN